MLRRNSSSPVFLTAVLLTLVSAAVIGAKPVRPPSGPQPLVLLNGWTNYGPVYGPATFHKDAYGRVHLSGLIQSGSWQAVIAALPEGFRPAARVVAGGNVHISNARVDILPTGEVVYVSGKGQVEWLSLSGISFLAAPAPKGKKGATALAPLALAAPWANYGQDYETATSYHAGGKVSVQGLLAGDSGEVGTLNETHRPLGRLIFTAMKGGIPGRVDVLADGRVFHVVAGGSTWLSLAGLAFEVPSSGVEASASLPLVNGWVDYGADYAGATYFKDGSGRVHLQGLIRSGEWGIFAQLPQGYRPSARLIFSGNNHESITRIDVTADGLVTYAGGSANNGWVSLSGISFDTAQ
jgi:hypothetical protein